MPAALLRSAAFTRRCHDERPMPRLQLIQRDDCPLCDQALAVLAAARAPEFDSVWIDDVDALEASYGTRVPVLRDTVSATELDWPFDAAAVRTFLATIG